MNQLAGDFDKRNKNYYIFYFKQFNHKKYYILILYTSLLVGITYFVIHDDGAHRYI